MSLSDVLSLAEKVAGYRMIFSLRRITQEQATACQRLLEQLDELRLEFQSLLDHFPNSDVLKEPATKRSWIAPVSAGATDAETEERLAEDSAHQHFIAYINALWKATLEFGWPQEFVRRFCLLSPAIPGRVLFDAFEKDKGLLFVVQRESMTWNFTRKLEVLAKRRRELRA